MTTAVKDKTTNTLNLETTTRRLKRFEMKYEDILSEIGDFGPYQRRVYYLLCLPAAMKAAVVMGIMQMLFGLLISYKNHTYFNDRLNVIGVFIPEMIFLCSIFVYLVITIIYKWLFWGSNRSDCAPSLLINLINIFMFVTPEVCEGAGDAFRGTPTYSA